jgi:hypothetical protein
MAKEGVFGRFNSRPSTISWNLSIMFCMIIKFEMHV